MGFKSKVLGLLSAGILSLSIVSGVVAQDTTATFNQNPNGTCTVAATQSTISFGVRQWDGQKYVLQGDTPVLNFHVGQTYGPGVGCNVTAKSSDLSKVGGGYTIGAANVRLNQGTGPGAVGGQIYISYGPTVVSGGAKDVTAANDYSFNIVLGIGNGVNVLVGDYTGTLTLTASKAP